MHGHVYCEERHRLLLTHRTDYLHRNEHLQERSHLCLNSFAFRTAPAGTPPQLFDGFKAMPPAPHTTSLLRASLYPLSDKFFARTVSGGAGESDIAPHPQRGAVRSLTWRCHVIPILRPNGGPWGQYKDKSLGFYRPRICLLDIHYGPFSHLESLRALMRLLCSSHIVNVLVWVTSASASDPP
jgi:hypothetical protein